MALNKEKIVFLIAAALCAYGIIDASMQVPAISQVPQISAAGSSAEPVSVAVHRAAFIADDFATLWGENKSGTTRDPFLRPEKMLEFGPPTVPLAFPPLPPVMRLAPALSDSPDPALVRPPFYENPPKPAQE